VPPANANDAIVPLTSQVNMTNDGITFSGIVHSPGIVQGLDFIGPSEQDSGNIASAVADLLNEQKDGTDFQH
jgi:hypothetical protein